LPPYINATIKTAKAEIKNAIGKLTPSFVAIF